MDERDLSTVLLVRAIEECDARGELLPLAERDAATRSALREAADVTPFASDGDLTDAGLRIMLDRARRLQARVADRERIPVPLAGGDAPRIFGWLVPVAAVVCGLGLSALDATGWVNILAFPLIGLIVWNLAVYAGLAVWHVRGTRAGATSPLLTALVRRIRSWRSATPSAATPGSSPWACAVMRYAREYGAASLPSAVARGHRLIHLGAALIAAGLIAGMYLRGLVYRYDAGWDSTFLGVEGVRAWLHVVYGPAATLSGIALPQSESEILALRASNGGSLAAPWIHLIALTAAIYVIVPRCVLAWLAWLEERRLARRMPLPEGIARYARATLGSVDAGLAGLVCEIVPYACEPDDASRAGLDTLMRRAFGAAVALRYERSIAYGEEDAYVAALSAPGPHATGVMVGLMSLAATPEREAHGVALAAWRDRVMRSAGAARLLCVVDEHPLRLRLSTDASYAGRLEERRALWQRFVADAGLPALVIDLSDAAAVAAAAQRIDDWSWPPPAQARS